jgi:2-isopropylmalate synthase
MQVQGTIGGIGERCGNANLCTLIPNIKLKMGIDCVSDLALEKLTQISRYISEIANLSHDETQPYVGNSAFAHKGGIHVSAITSFKETYEHVNPELVGNHSRVLISGLAGKSNILYKAEEYNIDLTQDTQEVKNILNQLKELENQGYQYEGAEGSFDLLMRKLLNTYQKLFDLEAFRVIIEKRGDDKPYCEATIKVKVKGVKEHTASEGDGPVNALDNALRKALEEFYPDIKKIKLSDFKVRVLDTTSGTAAKVRVLIESCDDKETWGTVGVSENIIEASWQALVDSIEYGLQKRE